MIKIIKCISFCYEEEEERGGGVVGEAGGGVIEKLMRFLISIAKSMRSKIE